MLLVLPWLMLLPTLSLKVVLRCACVRVLDGLARGPTALLTRLPFTRQAWTVFAGMDAPVGASVNVIGQVIWECSPSCFREDTGVSPRSWAKVPPQDDNK